MKLFRFFLIGIFFGIVLTKSQVISWFRIYEMFRFESFHMYGIIGSAVVLGAVGLFLMKKFGLKSTEGNLIDPPAKEKGVLQYLAGGIIFGLGWALIGACPGPLFALLGAGYWPIIISILGAIFGTFLYGLLKTKLPH